jgi:hypothetical protein
VNSGEHAVVQAFTVAAAIVVNNKFGDGAFEVASQLGLLEPDASFSRVADERRPRCPLEPEKQTFSKAASVSAKCQRWTSTRHALVLHAYLDAQIVQFTGRHRGTRRLIMYEIRLSRSSAGTMRFGIVGCGVCIQTFSARAVMPGLFAIDSKLGIIIDRDTAPPGSTL